jgi:hypothetical protein
MGTRYCFETWLNLPENISGTNLTRRAQRTEEALAVRGRMRPIRRHERCRVVIDQDEVYRK